MTEKSWTLFGSRVSDRGRRESRGWRVASKMAFIPRTWRVFGCWWDWWRSFTTPRNVFHMTWSIPSCTTCQGKVSRGQIPAGVSTNWKHFQQLACMASVNVQLSRVYLLDHHLFDYAILTQVTADVQRLDVWVAWIRKQSQFGDQIMGSFS